MAATSEQRLPLENFTLCSKRKFEAEEGEETCTDFVYTNGVFVPKNEKRRRFQEDESDECLQTLPDFCHGGHVQQSLQTSLDTQPQNTYGREITDEASEMDECMESMDTDTTAVETTNNSVCAEPAVSSNHHTYASSSSSCLNGKRINSCMIQQVPTYQYPGGLWESLLEVYHGL